MIIHTTEDFFKAIERLMHFEPEKGQKQRQRLLKLEEGFQQGAIRYEDYTITKNKIRKSLMSLLAPHEGKTIEDSKWKEIKHAPKGE